MLVNETSNYTTKRMDTISTLTQSRPVTFFSFRWQTAFPSYVSSGSELFATHDVLSWTLGEMPGLQFSCTARAHPSFGINLWFLALQGSQSFSFPSFWSLHSCVFLAPRSWTWSAVHRYTFLNYLKILLMFSIAKYSSDSMKFRSSYRRMTTNSNFLPSCL